VKSQIVPSQVVALAPVGLGHDVHKVPHESMLALDLQSPWQLWVPAGQVPSHAAVLAMHAPAQSFIPAGHAGTQAVPSQVTVPPIGSWQLMHDVVPQLPTSRLLTQRPAQRWYPVLHVRLHTPPVHWAVPLRSAGHTEHDAPHAAGSLSAGHLLPHLCVPVVH
jgi:hypothetical protein